MPRKHPFRSGLLLCIPWLVALLAAPAVRAQTDPLILSKPWQKGRHYAETFDDLAFIYGSHAQGDDHTPGGTDIDIFFWDSDGRVRLQPENPHPHVTIGYRVLAVTLGTDNVPDLPHDLFDASVVGAFKFGEIGDDWRLAVTAGGGSANDNHWANGDAYYGIGAVELIRPLDDQTNLHLGVRYDGNRTFLPDVPLPYIEWEHRPDNDLTYVLGVPRSSVRWRPFDPVTVSLEYEIPVNLAANINYKLTDHLGLYAGYQHDLNAFSLHDRGDTRLFYGLDRVTGGVRFVFKPWIDATLGVGYAFNQRFSTGYDIRSTDALVKPGDHLLFALQMRGTF